MRKTRILLILIAVVCFGVALSYPIRYRLAQDENNANMDELANMREQAREQAEDETENTTEGTPETEGASGVETEGTVSAGDQALSGGDEYPEDDEEPWDDDEPWDDEEPWDDGAEDEDGVPAMPVRPSLSPEDMELPTAPGTTPESEAPAGEGTSEGGEASDGQSEPAEATEAPVEHHYLENPTLEDLILNPYVPFPEDVPAGKPTPGPSVEATPEPTPTPPRDVYNGPLPYPMKEKVELDPSRILPELREIYSLNPDLVGWISIPGTVVDYPVVQTKDSDFYLDHDFYGNANINGHQRAPHEERQHVRRPAGIPHQGLLGKAQAGGI